MTTFDFAGAPQTYIVPADVRRVRLSLWGASGHDESGGGVGGIGAAFTCLLDVEPGEELTVYVGGSPDVSNGGGYNGGGTSASSNQGGGASDVRRGGTALADRVAIAGGGGGGGYIVVAGVSIPLAGGDGGQPGGNAAAGESHPGALQTPGGGATPLTGGTGGVGPGTVEGDGAAGELGQGAWSIPTFETFPAPQGGGGGGGLYGGGSGGWIDYGDYGPAPGGGGSSLSTGLGTEALAPFAPQYPPHAGRVIITAEPAVQSVVAVYPPLPVSTDQEIMWVGKLDSGVDLNDYFNGSLLRDGQEPQKVELLLAMSDGTQERVQVFVPLAGRFERLPMTVGDYLTPSFWGENNDTVQRQLHPVVTNVMWNVITPPGKWSQTQIESVVECIVTDSMGEYTVPVLMSTTAPPPPPRRSARVQTIKNFVAEPVDDRYGGSAPWTTFDPFYVSDDERFLYASGSPPYPALNGCRRFDLADWSYIDGWPNLPGLEGVYGGFRPIDINPDGSVIGVAGGFGDTCVEVAADGSSYRTIFIAPPGTRIPYSNARASRDHIFWFDNNGPGQLFRSDRVTGETVDTLFYDDGLAFPWGSNRAFQYNSWDDWTVSPDGTIWFNLDGPTYEHLNLNQCVARVRGADGGTDYEVVQIPVQALVDAQGTGFAQNYMVACRTTADGDLIFPSNAFNQYGTPDIPTDAEQGWYLLIQPDGTSFLIAGTYDVFGRIPPRATDTNISDGFIGESRIAENLGSQGVNASRTAFYWIDAVDTHHFDSLLRVLRPHSRGTANVIDHVQRADEALSVVRLPSAAVAVTPFAGAPPEPGTNTLPTSSPIYHQQRVHTVRRST